MRGIGRLAIAGSVLAALAIPATSAVAATAPVVKVVATGLNAPKHLTFSKTSLYVVESGTGGKTAAGNCVPGPATEGSGTTKYCVGRTGAVAVITGKGARRVLGGLPSIVQEDSGEVSGPAAVSFGPAGPALVYQDVLVGRNGGSAAPKPGKAVFGTLQLPSGQSVHLARFAASHPQAKFSLGAGGETAYDSDPYDVAAYHGGYVVADAAANSLLEVGAAGHVRLIGRFPTKSETVPAGAIGNPAPVTLTAQAVPTSVAVGPDGAIYVGLLRGVPSEPGTAFIYRVVPGQRPTVWATGLTAVTAIAFDHQGRLLATELSTGGLLAPPTVPGALVRVSANGKTVTTLPVSGLYDPTGVAVGPHGAVYVSNYGSSVRSSKTPGEVLEITGLG